MLPTRIGRPRRWKWKPGLTPLMLLLAMSTWKFSAADLVYAPLTCPSTAASPSEFLVIGHAGGDPVRHCENTLEATRSALERGANAIEIDVSMSKDGVLFLWHDPNPLDMLALTRRIGIALPGKCSPQMSSNNAASELTFRQVLSNWYYRDAATGRRHPEAVPTLDAWLAEFAWHPKLKLIWLDVKVEEPHLLPLVAALLRTHTSRYAIPPERLHLSVREASTAAMLRAALYAAGLDGSRVLSDTVAVQLVVADVRPYDGVSAALAACACCANLGAPVLAGNRWPALQQIVRLNVAHRDMLAGGRVRVYVWTIDDADEMKWLVQAGVNGVITNRPDVLAAVIGTTGYGIQIQQLIF